MSARKTSAALALLLLGGFTAPPPERLGEIPRPGFLAEGVAITPRGDVLVSGVEGRTILRWTRHGARPWLKGKATGGLFGMAADPRHDRLWISETDGADVPGGSGPGVTGVLEARLSDGTVLAHHLAPQDAQRHWIGDLVLAEDGTVFASDSLNGQLYRLKPGGKALEVVAETGLKSPQGLVMGRDGKSLILGDYPTGLHRIDLTTGEVGPAIPAGGAELRGLDGLKRHGRDLIATQNGTKTQRVLRLRLPADERSIEAVDVLAKGPDLLEDVSLGAVDGDRFVFVARSGWAGFDDKGRPNGTAPLPPVLAAVPLPPG